MTQITDYNEFHIINEGLNYWLFALLVLFVLSTIQTSLFLSSTSEYIFVFLRGNFIYKNFKGFQMT